MQIQGDYLPSGTTKYASAAAEEKGALLVGPGLLINMMASNVSSTDFYLWLFDSLSASGSPFLPPIKIAAGVTVALDGPAEPAITGLYFAASSTHATYTALAANSLMLEARVKG